LIGNFWWDVPENGSVCAYLGSQVVALLQEDAIIDILGASGLAVVSRTTVPLEGNGLARQLLSCRRRQIPYPLWHPYLPMNGMENLVTVLSEGSGCRVRDEHGKEYIDASGGLWSTQCGLGHPDIVQAIDRQLRQLSYGTLFAARGNKPALELARELVSIAPSPLQWVYLTGSGSESVELSIKLARLYQKLTGHDERDEIAYLDQSYHGTFFGSMGVSSLVQMKSEFGPLLPGVFPLPTPRTVGAADVGRSLGALEERIRRGSVAAFIMEPILGSAGVVIPPLDYFRAVQELCRRNHVLIILDEVATGFGRTGRWFAAEHFGLRPDLLLLSKAINSGYLPPGAVLFSAEIGSQLLESRSGIGHGSSHNGNPVCCAAALASIDVIRRERLVERAAESGDYFRGRLDECRAFRQVKDVRSQGLMLAIELQQLDGTPATPEQISTIYTALKELGVLVYPGPSSLIFMPALVITHDEIDFVTARLRVVLSAVELRDGSLEMRRAAGN
jgi:adenosylmethionine-8-amino-7-oxononanoate aminotransferase